MIEFQGGIADGKTLQLSRAPFFLRVVFNEQTKQLDALDKLRDIPEEGESIHVYRMIKYSGAVHVHAKKCGGWRQMATYVIHDIQPDDDHTGENRAWQRWTTEQYPEWKAEHERLMNR